MTILARHILHAVIWPSAIALLILLALLVGVRLTMAAELVGERPNALTYMAQIIAQWLPHYLGLAVPFALFYGLYSGFSRLHQNGELAAIMALGVSPWRLLGTVSTIFVPFALLLTVIVYSWAQPLTLYANKVLVNYLLRTHALAQIGAGQFRHAANYTFVADEVDSKNGRFSRVFIFAREKGQKAGSSTITAREAIFGKGKGDVPGGLRLYDGLRVRVLPGKGHPVPGETTRAATLTVPFFISDRFRPRGRAVEEFTIPELIAMLWGGRKMQAPRHELNAELQYRLVLILFTLVLPMAALLAASSNPRMEDWLRKLISIAGLIIAYEGIINGAILARRGITPAWLSIWIPALTILLIMIWQWWRSMLHPRH